MSEARSVVWIVDDSRIQAEITRRSLANHHDVVIFAAAGTMLERLAMGERPDLLILDWHMPDISGLEACKFIRGHADGAELPIIVLTATGHHGDLLLGMDAGANDFVRKPCEETELLARVRGHVLTKRLHVQLKAAEAALRDEASFRERFLAILAHDLRQPLNVFALGSHTLAAPETKQHVRDRVRTHFDRATARMQRMIAELLDLSRSRPQGGGMPITLARIDLVDVVRDVVAEVRLAHPTREVDCELCANCPGRFDGDRLAQVVGNLVENAITHSAPSSRVKVVMRTTLEHVEVSVENQGTPIAPQIQATLFDPFRRGSARTMNDRGLGLGLYIVDQIVRAHGGTVSVASDEAGTRFRVSLPIGDASD